MKPPQREWLELLLKTSILIIKPHSQRAHLSRPKMLGLGDIACTRECVCVVCDAIIAMNLIEFD